MSIDSFVEVLVFLDKLFHIVWLRGVRDVANFRLVLGRSQELLPSTHPAFSLLAVAVEQLEFQVLVQLHAAAYPSPKDEGRLRLGEFR